ncbi:DUF72 domain-containing protein [Thermodesulfobacteriota bacterium]
MSNILIGTSGFFYDGWKGEFYPQEIDSKNYLNYYSLQFKALELNFSYYRIPEAHQSRRMISRSGGNVEFVVKAHRRMTHEIAKNSLTEILPLFIEGISPFLKESRLGAVLLQFPQSFHYVPDNRVYLKSLIDALQPLPVSVEFRQREWLKDSVYETLRGLGVGFVCVDEPSLPGLIPSVVINTSKLGYVRFHGRNKRDWYGTDTTTRYDYLYSEDELKEWVPKIQGLAESTEKVFVFFNNHAKAQAVTNAKMLMNLLAQ